MKKLVVLLMVLALFASPVQAQSEADIVLFADDFETGYLYAWNGVGGNVYDTDVLPWYSCQTFTGYWCARSGAYGAGQKSYLIDTRPGAPDFNWYAQWDSSVETTAPITQPSVLMRFVSDTGVILMELRVHYSNSKVRVRLACRDYDDPQFMKYSVWLAMPESWNGLFAGLFRIGWHKGTADTGGCWFDMYDSIGNKQGVGMLFNTGDWNPGKVLIGAVNNPSAGMMEQWYDNYQDHSIR